MKKIVAFLAMVLLFSGALASETTVYYTLNGMYFHLKQDCSGMRNANPNTIDSAISQFKKPCPVCFNTEEKREIYRLPLPENETDAVYIAVTNYYYHRDPGCFDMVTITKLEKQIAETMNMKPCPHCLSSFVDAEAMERAYISDESRYYHSNEVCPELGDSGSVRGAFAEQAQAQGKFRCPECNQTKPKDAAIFEKTLGQSLAALREGYIFEREDIVGNRRIWYFSNGEEAKESCIYSVKETDASEEPNDFSFDDLTKEFVAYLDVGFASREESLRFMKKVPEPIKSIYEMAPDVVREYVSELGLDKKLQTFGWVMIMRIYFDEDQQIGRCEMGFGDYGDGIVLDWGIEKDGSVRLIRKWQGVLNFFV